MTEVEKIAIAVALRKARPAVIPGTNLIANNTAREVWYDAVREVAAVVNRGQGDSENRLNAAAFFDAAGVPN